MCERRTSQRPLDASSLQPPLRPDFIAMSPQFVHVMSRFERDLESNSNEVAGPVCRIEHWLTFSHGKNLAKSVLPPSAVPCC